LHGGNEGGDGGGTDGEEDNGRGNSGKDSEDGREGGTETTDDGQGDGEEGTETSQEDGDGGDGELDLREANVVDVSFEGSDGSYTFNVTIYHDDDGEDGYANWWQVESLDGERLGRRDLAHPHGTRRFTRSTTVDTGGERCVVVRGHDGTHGYGGHAVVVNVETGEVRGFRQGGEPSSFNESDCP